MPQKKIDPLQRRVPKNPAYEHVKRTLDTGPSMVKFLEQHDEHHLNARFRQAEPFRRVKSHKLAEVILENEQSWRQDHEELEPLDDLQQSSPVSPTSAFATTRNRCPYLLLDVRENDQYEKCHIVTALNYPSRLLYRSTNELTPELFIYKNKEGHLIVLYDDDEQIAVPMAKTFFEKGFDNVFVLTKGLRQFGQDEPEYCMGEIPPAPTPPATARSTRPNSRMNLTSSSSTNATGGRTTPHRTSSGGTGLFSPRSQLTSRSSATSSSTARRSYMSFNRPPNSITRTDSSASSKPWKPS